MSCKKLFLQVQGGVQSGVFCMKSEIPLLQSGMNEAQLIQENVFLPRLSLRAEDHTAIQRQFKHLSVVNRMQDDILALKSVVKYLSQELEALKSAL